MHFNKDYIDMFLGVVRKYMQMRGMLTQKDLAELTDVGVSTMSRFLNQKTKDIDTQLIAKIVAKLEIPLHEIIDFVEESFTEKFIKLVRFYREDEKFGKQYMEGPTDQDVRGTSEREGSVNIKIGGKTTRMPFVRKGGSDKSDGELREKIANLSPRQKVYLSDFLDLDDEGRDLIVDIGNSLFRYFRQKGVDF